MRCEKCSKSVPEGIPNCPYCGATLKTNPYAKPMKKAGNTYSKPQQPNIPPVQPAPSAVAPAGATNGTTGGGVGLILGIVGGVLALAIIITVVVVIASNRKADSDYDEPTTSYSQTKSDSKDNESNSLYEDINDVLKGSFLYCDATFYNNKYYLSVKSGDGYDIYYFSDNSSSLTKWTTISPGKDRKIRTFRMCSEGVIWDEPSKTGEDHYVYPYLMKYSNKTVYDLPYQTDYSNSDYVGDFVFNVTDKSVNAYNIEKDNGQLEHLYDHKYSGINDVFANKDDNSYQLFVGTESKTGIHKGFDLKEVDLWSDTDATTIIKDYNGGKIFKKGNDGFYYFKAGDNCNDLHYCTLSGKDDNKVCTVSKDCYYEKFVLFVTNSKGYFVSVDHGYESMDYIDFNNNNKLKNIDKVERNG